MLALKAIAQRAERSAIPAGRGGVAMLRFLAALVELARPRQWIKNGFVFVPIIFAGDLRNADVVVQALVVFFCFCFSASAVYFLNDVVDAPSDRQHPRKQHRPIASGRVPASVALALAALLATASLVVGFGAAAATGGVIAAYVGLNILYSLRFKHVALLDVFFVATGFLLRILAGSTVSTIPASPWILLMGFFLALFLSLGKRRGELTALASAASTHRRSLAAYSVQTVDQMLVALSGIITVTFSIYSVSEYAISRFGTEALVFTVPVVVYGLFRYLHLVNDLGVDTDPTELILSDRPLLFAVLVWVVACAFIIY